jgi:hypothetical protein
MLRELLCLLLLCLQRELPHQLQVLLRVLLHLLQVLQCCRIL